MTTGAAVALIALLWVPLAAKPAAAVFGGYILFWFALTVRRKVLDRIRPRQDISYGLYLYGWPVQMIIIDNFRDVSPWVLSGATLAIASVLGLLSWVMIERPALKLKPSKLPGSNGTGRSTIETSP